MYTIFAILIVIASILLIGVILIQKSKGGGLVSGVNTSAMGVPRTNLFIEKATWALSIFICVLSIASAFVSSPTIVKGNVPQISAKAAAANENKQPDYGTMPAQGNGQAPAPAQGGGQAPAATPAQ